MFKVPSLPFISCVFGLVQIFALGVVREKDLAVRWTFDEGNGSVANDVTGGGIDLLLSAYAKWGSIDVNNTAVSKYSLNLMEEIPMDVPLLMTRSKLLILFLISFGLNPMVSPILTASFSQKRKTVIHPTLCKSSPMVKV